MSSPRISTSTQRDYTLPPLPETPRRSGTAGTIELPPLKDAKLIAEHRTEGSSATVQPGPGKILQRAAMNTFRSVRDGFKALRSLISTAQEHHFQRALLAKGLRALRTYNAVAIKPGAGDRAQQLEQAGAALDRIVSQMSDQTIAALSGQAFAQLAKVDLTAASKKAKAAKELHTKGRIEDAEAEQRAAKGLVESAVQVTAKRQSSAVNEARGMFAQTHPSPQLESFASGLEELLLNSFRKRLPELVQTDLNSFRDDENAFFRANTERSVALVALMHKPLTSERKNDWEEKVIKWATPEQLGTPLPIRDATQGASLNNDSLTEEHKEALEKCVVNVTRGLLQELNQSMPREWRELLQMQDKALESGSANDGQRRKAVIDAVFLRVVNAIVVELGQDSRCSDQQKAVVRYVASQLQRIANGVKAADPELVREVNEFAMQLLQP